MSSVVAGLAWPRMWLTCTTSRAEVDDDVAREGVSQVVEAQPRAVSVKPGGVRGSTRARFVCTLRWLSGVPLRVANTQSPGDLNVHVVRRSLQERRELRREGNLPARATRLQARRAGTAYRCERARAGART